MATLAAPVSTATATGEYGGTGIWSWLTTVDHKRIGTLYLFTALFFFCWGGMEADRKSVV